MRVPPRSGIAALAIGSLAHAYQQVIDKYSLTGIDLDIEDDDLGDAAGEARRSFWSLNRDRQCTGSTGWADGKCSGVSRQPYDFAQIIARYTG